MATSFRFLYWRICCYVCTRTAKRPRNARSRQRSVRGQRYARSQPPPSFRRSMKMTQRSGNDSGFGPSMGHAHSDPELRIMGRGVGGGYGSLATSAVEDAIAASSRLRHSLASSGTTSTGCSACSREC
ncbi:uncharacterized protein LOC117195188 [Drosophila miranda]|uniref:uncharacterized protein LOC117195188 n=1 Tax=Drosophila miranda TaxID=7229 RepID=UPI00143F56C8|nr:uncharacterized protein LOC117195188 [Drosophila miranda]